MRVQAFTAERIDTAFFCVVMQLPWQMVTDASEDHNSYVFNFLKLQSAKVWRYCIRELHLTTKDCKCRSIQQAYCHSSFQQNYIQSSF